MSRGVRWVWTVSSQGLTQISSLGTEQRDPKHNGQVSQSKDTMNL